MKMPKKLLKYNQEKRHLPLKLFTLGVILVVISVTFVFRTAMAIHPIFTANNHPINKPFVVGLDQSLRNIDTDQIRITPKIDGKWQFDGGGFLGASQLVFTPAEDFRVNTNYTVDFGDVQRYLFGSNELPAATFTTEKAPALANSGVNQLEDGAIIVADYTFAVSLVSANRGLRKIEIKTEPAIALEASVTNDTDYLFKPQELLPHSTEIVVEVIDTKNNVSLKKVKVKVADEPSVKTMVHADHFGQKEVAKVEFNQPIDPESRQYITFDLDGEGNWESDTIYAFTPAAVEAGKTYGYHIKVGFRSKDGGILTKDVDGQFATVGAVVVTSSSPRGKELSQGQQTVKFTFDQAVDHASAEQHFKISGGTVTGFSWSGNTMSATVKNLGFQQTITASVAAGVKNAEFGLPSSRAFSVSFTTEIRAVKLGVPYYRQQHSATCTAATLRMALAFYGISTGEEEIVVNRMGYNPRPMDTATNTWDDPRVMFVGYMDGTTQTTAGGAEVPLQARVAGSYGRGVSQRSGGGVNVNWIAQEIHNGHPVIISGTGVLGGAGRVISYVAPTGRTVLMSTKGHSRIAYGVKGEPGAPLTFYVHDPSRGSLTWSASQLQSNLATNPYGGQAVAIY